MPITPTPAVTTPVADTDTPFNVTLATTDIAQDLVLVPAAKKGRAVSLVNEGPGAVALAFDSTATVSGLLLETGDAYDEHNLEVSTKVSFINKVTGDTPRVRGVLWSGD
jgi:hypothetical protein